MSKQLLFWASLAGLPLISHAQTVPASSRYYIGVGANLLTNVPFTSGGAPRLVGPSITAGLQFSPTLALQVGISYHWKSETYPLYFVGQGTPGYMITNDDKYLTAPVLLRYTFNPSAERFHFDGLAGATVLFGIYGQSSSGTPNLYYIPVDNQTTSTKVCLTLGPAARYSLSPHVDLTADGLVSAGLGNAGSLSDRLFLNVLVGARYTFGQR